MKGYVLNVRCPYDGDVELVGIYTDKSALEIAKEIKARCSRIDNFSDRFEVETIGINVLPWDCDKGD